MSADQEFTGFRCYCAHCIAPGEGDSAAWNRSYYVPDPPKIPPPPGNTATTAPPPEPGYTGPRHLTLLRGDDWNDPQVGTPAVVTYTFATRAMSNYAATDGGLARPGFDATSGQPLSEAQRAGIRQALGAWEQVSGLTFVEVADPGGWEFDGVRFLMEGLDSPGLLGLAYPNADPYGFNVVFNRSVYGGASLQPGTDGFWTALHEIGHAIGLKHPFADDPVLRASEDTNRNTVMSYTDKGNLSGLGPFDVAAAQHIYGAPEAKAALPVRWSQGPNGSLVTAGNEQANTILGISGRDIVHGGGGDDYIATKAGDDYVVSGRGSDAVFGGDGADTLHVGVLWRQAASSVAIEEGGEIQGTVSMSDSVDTFYGVETIAYADISVALDPRGAVGQLHRLYKAALDREPDRLGLSHWVDALDDGTAAMAQVAASFAGSAEFATRYGAGSDADFVKALYKNVLGREPSAREGAEVGYWMNAVNVGGRGGVLLGFAESKENQDRTKAGFGNGVWYPNEEAVDVLRAYMTVLDRLPDADGLIGWVGNLREGVLSRSDVVAHLASSPEFQARFGGLSNQHFVEHLYRTALDREADPNEAAYWAWILDAGIDGRAGVALGFAGSAEMTAKVTPFAEYGALYA